MKRTEKISLFLMILAYAVYLVGGIIFEDDSLAYSIAIQLMIIIAGFSMAIFVGSSFNP